MKQLSPRFWQTLIIGGMVIDSSLIITVAVLKLTILLYIFIIVGIAGVIFMNKIWNEDERTDELLSDSSRTTVFFFFIVQVVVGIGFLLFDQTDVGSALIVSAVLLMYFQLFLAVSKDMGSQ